VKWTWLEVGNNTNVIKATYSADCKEWDTSVKRMIYYKPTTGKVTGDDYSIGGKEQTNPHPAMDVIFGQVFGSSDKVNLIKDEVQIGELIYPFFQVKNKKAIYLNYPDHALHAVALNWLEKDADSTWNYVAFSSDPSLPTIKE
jgi:hypothetical protein